MKLPSPSKLQNDLPLTSNMRSFIDSSRQTALNILSRKDKRLALIMGPCSIHDLDAAIEYATRFKELSKQVSDRYYLIMRAYVEKPRTIKGWKGLIYDPHLDHSHDIAAGIELSRTLFSKLTEMEVPIATEFLDPLTTPYLEEFVTWGFIGARTTASQPHRQLASSFNFPIGFKNAVYGDIECTVQGLLAAKEPHTFIHINDQAALTKKKTLGNPNTHIVLRGTDKPNCDPTSIAHTLDLLSRYNLPRRLIIDCAHGNSRKTAQGQITSFTQTLSQISSGNDAIFGIMLESFLEEGHQPHLDPLLLRYGFSITDPCLSWEQTEKLFSKN